MQICLPEALKHFGAKFRNKQSSLKVCGCFKWSASSDAHGAPIGLVGRGANSQIHTWASQLTLSYSEFQEHWKGQAQSYQKFNIKPQISWPLIGYNQQCRKRELTLGLSQLGSGCIVVSECYLNSCNQGEVSLLENCSSNLLRSLAIQPSSVRRTDFLLFLVGSIKSLYDEQGGEATARLFQRVRRLNGWTTSNKRQHPVDVSQWCHAPASLLRSLQLQMCRIKGVSLISLWDPRWGACTHTRSKNKLWCSTSLSHKQSLFLSSITMAAVTLKTPLPVDLHMLLQWVTAQV